MELSHQLAEQLTLLEQQAAQCAALLYDAPPEVLEEVVGAFAPPPALKITTLRQRETWGRTWIAWVMESGYRWEERPPAHPAGEDLGEVLLAWARR